MRHTALLLAAIFSIGFAANAQTCVVEFSNTTGGVGDTIHFTQHGSTATAWFWNFGDGTMSNAQSPSHVYSAPGTYNVCVGIITNNGDTCDYCRNVQITGTSNCVVEFSNTSGGVGDTLQFTQHGSTATAWFWNFGDGTTSNAQSPAHVYSAPGTYNVCVGIITNNGDTCDYCRNVQITGTSNCVVEFSNTSGGVGDTLQFTQHGSTATAWFWNFGDGTTSNAQSPAHVYSAPGTYNVCVGIITNNGDTCDYCRNVQITGTSNCVVEFSNTTGGVGDTLQFTQHGSTATTWFWNFGDGTTSNAQSPAHVYSAPGTYNVCVGIITNNGDTCDYCRNVQITGTSNCVVEFSNTSGGVGDTLHFTQHGSTATAWYWNFGDGTTSNAQSPAHVYSAPGTYNVCVGIITNNGDTCDYCRNVQITGTSNCVVEFSNTSGGVGDTLQFTQHGSTATAWFWNFGDGTTSNAQSPAHVYSAPGTYNVCVGIITNNGDTCDYCRNVQITGTTNCVVEFSNTSGGVGDSIHFTQHGSTAVSWSWDFGDGTTSSIQNPTHVFSSLGSYTICLVIVTANGVTCDYCSNISMLSPGTTQRQISSIFPSISNGQIHARIEHIPLPVILRITDLSGHAVIIREIDAEGIHDFSLNLFSGMYIYSIYNGQTVFNRNMMVIVR